jgi:hypothetical protein
MPRRDQRPDHSSVRYPNEGGTQCPLDGELAAGVSDELWLGSQAGRFLDRRLRERRDDHPAWHGVGSLREKREAKKAAQRVYGVISVHNQLKVKL